jgi:tRNA(His) guanylyltransferase
VVVQAAAYRLRVILRLWQRLDEPYLDTADQTMSLSDRMKDNYELRQRPVLLRRQPVIIRLDGRAFHTLTRSMDRPFDYQLHMCMVYAMQQVAAEAQGCMAGYMQSDEISLLLIDYATHETEAWFDYNQAKLCSVSASICTAHFNACFRKCFPTRTELATFDARAFNIPREEVVNYFLWRAKDWERNSVSMFTRSLYSHKEMMNKSVADMHEMLYQKGKNWADLEPQWKNGVWVLRKNSWLVTRPDIVPSYETVKKELEPYVYCDADRDTPERAGNTDSVPGVVEAKGQRDEHVQPRADSDNVDSAGLSA